MHGVNLFMAETVFQKLLWKLKVTKNSNFWPYLDTLVECFTER